MFEHFELFPRATKTIYHELNDIRGNRAQLWGQKNKRLLTWRIEAALLTLFIVTFIMSHLIEKPFSLRVYMNCLGE